MMAFSYDVLLEYGVLPYDELLEYGACSYDVFLGYGVCFQVAGRSMRHELCMI